MPRDMGITRSAKAGSKKFSTDRSVIPAFFTFLTGAGLRAQTTVRYTWGKLVPTGRIELRHRATGAYDQTMAYSDLLSRTYVLRRAATRTDSVGASLGARAIFGLTEVGLEYGTSASALSDLGGGELRVSLRKGF